MSSKPSTLVVLLWIILIAVVDRSIICGERVKDADTGIDLKVIVTAKEGTSVLDAPDGKEQGVDLPVMQIRFVMSTDDNKEFAEVNGEKWYRISRDGVEADGWVRGKDVATWKTRSALKPNAIPDREFVVNEPKRPDGSPLSSDIRYNGSAPDNYQLLAPILEPRKNDDEPYSVFVFGGQTQGSGGNKLDALSGKAVESMAFSDAKLEIVFVVDTTASMTPLLDGVKQVVAEISIVLGNTKDAEGKRLDDRVRFGLVEYQDSTTGLVPAKVRIKLTDAKTFGDEVASVQVAQIGSVEWQEDVVAGLLAAIDRKEDGEYKGNVGWSANSSKHIILCGDASALTADNPKSSTQMSIEDVLKKAIPDNLAEDAEQARRQIWFHAILALNDDGKDDWENARNDFKEVTENLAKYTGEFAEMVSSDKASRTQVVDLFTNQKIKDALDGLGGKKLSQTQIQNSAFARSVYLLKDGTPLDGVAFGKANERNEDDQAIAIEAWFIRFKEMQNLKTRLRFLFESLNNLSAAERKSNKVLIDALHIAFSTAGVGEPVNDSNLADVVKGLPLKNDVLNITIDDVARMDDTAYKQWLTRLEASEKRCDEILNVKPGGSGLNAWLVLGDNSSTAATTDHYVTFIPVDQLP